MSSAEEAQEAAAAVASTAMLEDLEQQYRLVMTERDSLREQLQVAQSELRKTLDSLTDASASARDRVEQEEAQKRAEQKIQNLEQELKLVEERSSRVQTESDSLREEISTLTNRNEELSKELATAQVQAKLSESDAIPLLHAKERLQTELDSVNAHSDWLKQELDAKQSDYQHLQSQSRDRLIQLQLQHDQTRDDLEAVTAKLTFQEKMERELQDKLETLTRDNLDLKQQLVSDAEQAKLDVSQQARVIDLQKEQLQRWESRCGDIERENENLRLTAQKALEASKTEQEQLQLELESKYQNLMKERLTEYESKIQTLQSSAASASSDRLLLLNAPPAAIAPQVEMEDGPVGMTELYERLEQTKVALRAEQTERKKWQQQFDRVSKEIQARAPELVRQREEFEIAVSQIQDYQTRIDNLTQERDDAAKNEKQAITEAAAMRNRLADVQTESQDLAKQVQALLVSRSTGSSGGDIPVSVKEMQNQNQQLRNEYRRLSGQVEELEEKLQTNSMRKKLEKSEAELAALKEQRKEQEILVEKIVQQRDLYRALLHKSDSRALGSETEELTALEMVKKQSETAKKYEHLNMELEGELKEAKFQMEQAVKDKSDAEERLKRSEAITNELSDKSNQLERDLITARSEAARVQADTSFHKDKCVRVEEALERSRQEIVQVNRSRGEFQRINSELQSTISEGHAERSRLESDKRQVEAKLRLIEAQLSSAKSSESRQMEENQQLRNEVARQGAMIESIRRIENTLSAKAESEKEQLSIDLQALTEKLESASKRYDVETSNLQSQRDALDAKFQEAQSSGAKFQLEALTSKKDLLTATTELQALKSKHKTVENQLKAAKRKLGEENDIEDIEVTLRGRIDTLETELESVKAENKSLTERVENLKKLSKTSEDSLSELKEATERFKDERKKEIDELEKRLQASQHDNASKQEIVRDLTLDLAKQADERKKAEGELQSQILALNTQIENNAKDVESAKAADASLKLDISNLRDEVASAQNNYERELSLHSQARTALRAAQESSDEESRLRSIADKKVDEMRQEIEQKKTLWEAEKTELETSITKLEQTNKDSRDQNKVLHEQIESLNEMIEKSQSSRISDIEEADDGAEKRSKEMREMIKFLRAENELAQTELDTKARIAEREKSAANVVRKSLEEARAELDNLRSKLESVDTASSSTRTKELEEKLSSSADQLKLLQDSNTLLREEATSLKTTLASTKAELSTAKQNTAPTEDVQRELGLKITSLEAEKKSLQTELDSWKGRMTSLVSNFNQIDPTEHEKLKTAVADLTKETDSLKKMAEQERTRLRSICTRQKANLDKLDAEAKKLKSEKAALEKSSSQQAALEKERNSLKTALIAKEKEIAERKSQYEGEQQRTERLREMLRRHQSNHNKLKEEYETLKSRQEEVKESESGDPPPTGSANDTPNSSAAEGTEAVKSTGPKPKVDESKPVTPKSKEAPKATVPKVPTEGFKFGPSSAVAPKPTSDKPFTGPQGPEKKSTKVTSSETKSTKVASLETKTSLKASAKSFVPGSKQAAPADIQAAKAESQAGKAKRRLSGEKREQEMKAKLLEKKLMVAEKKRRLEKMKAEKESAAKAANEEKKRKSEAPVSSTEEQTKKKIKATDSPEKTSGKATQPEGPGSSKATDSTDKRSKPVDKQPPKTKPTTKSGKEKEPEEKRPAEKKPESSTLAGFANPFSSSTTAKSPMTFGKPATLGSGVKSSSFLDIKPPGSSSGAPSFSFGSSSITLPTPSLDSSPGPFGTFATSSGSTFAGLSSKPLFGATKEAADDEDDKEEDTDKKE